LYFRPPIGERPAPPSHAQTHAGAPRRRPKPSRCPTAGDSPQAAGKAAPPRPMLGSPVRSSHRHGPVAGHHVDIEHQGQAPRRHVRRSGRVGDCFASGPAPVTEGAFGLRDMLVHRCAGGTRWLRGRARRMSRVIALAPGSVTGLFCAPDLDALRPRGPQDGDRDGSCPGGSRYCAHRPLLTPGQRRCGVLQESRAGGSRFIVRGACCV